MSTKRTATFERNAALETLLGRLNAAIAETSLPTCDAAPLPPLFVLGTPRSGSTFCMQWLAESGAFSYPSNLIARFGPSAMFLMIALAHAGLILFGFTRMLSRKTMKDRTSYIWSPRTSFTIGRLTGSEREDKRR